MIGGRIMINKIVLEDLQEIVAENLDWEKLKNSTVLITGASGMLPSYMAETLLYLNQNKNLNIKVVGVVRNLEKAKNRFAEYANRNDLILIKHDVCQSFHYDDKVDYIIHAAGQASPKFYGSDPVGTLEGHVIGTANFLRFAVEKNIKCFLYFSSCAVYGDNFEQCANENFVGKTDSLDLRSCYPLGKLTGENLCVAYHHQYKIPFKILRIAHTYGPLLQLDDGRVFADFVANILRNENISLNSDGSAERPLLYISDAVKGYFKILLHGENCSAYNVASEEYIRILDLANILINLYPEKNLQVVFNKKISNNYLLSKNRVQHIDVTKLKNLGWIPKISAREGFKRTVESFNYHCE